MNKKHILIVSFAYPPLAAIGSRRIAMIAKELYDQGYIPHIVTAENPPQKHSLENLIPQELVHHVKWLDIYQLKYKLEKFKVTKILGKIIEYILGGTNTIPERRRFFWINPGIKKGLEIIDKFDIELIYSSYAPPASIRIAAALKKKTGIPWINEYRDLWSGNPYLNLSKRKNRINLKEEKKLICKADALITVSEPLKRDLIKLHNKPTYVIYNGIDQLTSAGNNTVNSNKIRIVYAGTIYKGKRDPMPLFLALKMLKARDYSLYNKFTLDFYGPAMDKILGNTVKQIGIEEVVNLNQSVSHKDILGIQSNADILLLLGWNNIADEGVLTGKIFEYLGMKKPILALGYENGAMDKVLHETKTGKIINDPEKLCNYLIGMAKIVKNKNQLEHFQENINIKPYLRKNQVQNLIHIINKTIKS